MAGRERSPCRQEAFKMYLEREGEVVLADLARFLKVKPAQIRRWKAEDGWDEELAKPMVERKVIKHPVGGPYGNQNALGHEYHPTAEQIKKTYNRGAPPGTVHNEKTLEQSAIYLDSLTADEQFLYDAIPQDPIEEIDESIKLLKIRERRMLRNLDEVRNEKSMREEVMMHQVLKGKNKGDLQKEVTKTLQPLTDKIVAIEDALTRVQTTLIKAIAEKSKMIQEREQENEQKGSTIVFQFNRY